MSETTPEEKIDILEDRKAQIEHNLKRQEEARFKRKADRQISWEQRGARDDERDF